ncbi:unnamed protein product [Moneuplotes crassus]|uniref:Uncharacterized protein n=1 Tax=Euplotes crassus TaxID=5936 RepID=A0AAD1XK86_EUPCR|nr:unnamed protein product [Moneuplotes crassus]
MNKAFQSCQESPRLASWVENSISDFCSCQAETPHSQIDQRTNHCEFQTWLPSIADGDALNALFDCMQIIYCFCVGGHRQENTSAKSSEVAESLNKDSQQFVHPKLEQSEESKSIPKTESEDLLQVEAPARHQLNGRHSEADDEPEESSLKYRTRKDVVHKAAFRRMKKYFIEDFQMVTQHCSEQTSYLTKLQEYCSLRFQESNTSQACMMLDYIINPKNKLGVIPHEDRHLKRLVGKLVSCCSLKLLRQIETQPEFLEILLHFLVTEGVSRMIFEDHRVCFQSRVQIHLQQLKERVLLLRSSLSQ